MNCLNCGASLTDRFCAACGQRVVPPYPTMREMAGDAWDEMVGYDGRFLRSLRLLLLHPGQLTNEVLQGRRARYIFPVRLYLFASFVYFVLAALAPPVSTSQRGFVFTDDTVTIRLDDASSLTAEQRDRLLEQVDELPDWAEPWMRSVLNDLDGFKQAVLANMPRALFALVPLFAAVMKLFYRGGWVQHMIFSLHLHAGLFLILTTRELARFSGNRVVVGIVAAVTLFGGIGYALAATRTVYSERWARVVLKFVPILVIYAIGYIIAIVGALIWAASR